MKMSQFIIVFDKKIFVYLKSIIIDGNIGRSASYVISMDAKYYSG